MLIGPVSAGDAVFTWKKFCHFDECQDYDCLLSDLKNTAKMEHYFFKKPP